MKKLKVSSFMKGQYSSQDRNPLGSASNARLPVKALALACLTLTIALQPKPVQSAFAVYVVNLETNIAALASTLVSTEATSRSAQISSDIFQFQLLRSTINGLNGANAAGLGQGQAATTASTYVSSQHESAIEVSRYAAQTAKEHQIIAGVCTTGAASSNNDRVSKETKTRNYGRTGGGGGGGKPRLDNSKITGSKTDSSTYNNVIDATSPVSKVGPEVSTVQQGLAHVKRYCTAAEVADPSISQVCQTEGTYPNADSDPESITVGAGAVKQNRITLTLSEDQKAAADLYISKIATMGGTVKPLTRRQLTTPIGNQYFGLSKEYEGVINLAALPLRDMLARRLPVESTKPGSPDSYVDNAEKGGDPGVSELFALRKQANEKNYADGISQMDMMDFEVERRFGNPSWIAELHANPGAVPKEQAIMQSLQNKLMLMQFYEQEKTNALLGSLLAAEARRFYPTILSRIYGQFSTLGLEKEDPNTGLGN